MWQTFLDRYMYEKISDRSEGELIRVQWAIFTHPAYLALDDRIDDFADIVRNYYDVVDLGDPGASAEVSSTILYYSKLETFVGRSHYCRTHHI
jgi:hypothetical protein